MKYSTCLLLLLIIFPMFSGCESNDDLDAFIQKVNERKNPRIAPLPEMQPERVFERKEIRDLFAPLKGSDLDK